MSVFLCVYSKSGGLNQRLTGEALDDFSLGGKRALCKIEVPGFMLSFPERFAGGFLENSDDVTFVAGYFKNSAAGFRTSITSPEINSDSFHGAFAAVHYQKKTHRLTAANDKYGIFPLFVYENNDLIALCSEYQPLCLLSGKKKPVLNRDAIAEYYCLGTTLGNKTFFNNIYNLPPAAINLFNGKKSEVRGIHWHSASNSATAAGVLDTFTTVNREYLESGLTTQCLLSAGADSRLILATMPEAERKKTNFYTSNLSFLDMEEDMDVIGAQLLAKKFDLSHQVEKISFYENTFGTNFFDSAREPRKNQVYGGWHGGELLGGYCLRAAPAGMNLSFEETDKKLKRYFSWSFRIRLSRHPYQSYVEEKKQAGSAHVFLLRQLTRSFFSSIYGGSRGHWLQPFQLTHHGLSPFWDSRFLDAFTKIPLEALKDYAFYNEVMALCDKAFTGIPSNSPLTNRHDSVIPKLNLGTEPKHHLPNVHREALEMLLGNESPNGRGMYASKQLQMIRAQEETNFRQQWIDFEIWKKRYG